MDQLDALNLMPNSFDLPWQAHQLAQMIARREVSCREVMEAYLAQIERLNPKVGALISLQPPELLLHEADAKDAALARGEPCGMLYGLPHAVKDLALTKGIRTTFGSPLFKDEVPQQDSIMVERLKAAGAIVIGKTNVPEFGMGSQTYNPLFGATGNAYDPTLTAGGSSGGAATALALQLVPLADGSDMMGSLRNPAAWNNVYGLRPSQGRVPGGPGPELFIVPQLSVEGPMGRSVADVAALLRTQAGYTPAAPLSLRGTGDLGVTLERDFNNARIGWLGDFNGYLATDPGLMALCEAGLEQFRALGIEIEPCQPDYDMERLWQCWLVHRQWLLTGALGAMYANPASRAQLKPELRWEIESARGLTAEEVFRASVDRSDWYRALLALFARYDYLLLPSAQTFPFDKTWHWPRQIAGRPMDAYHRWMEVAVGATLAGFPVMNVPIGFNAAGLPMGVQVVGPAQADFAVLQLAHAHEQSSRWVQRRPPPALCIAT